VPEREADQETVDEGVLASHAADSEQQQAAVAAVADNDAYNWGQGLTLVHYSAQPEPFFTQNTPKTPPANPCHPLNTP
jgi:hypothetical protein